jgi:thiamine biosynthesis lipoprotein
VEPGRAEWQAWGGTATVLVTDATVAPRARHLVEAEIARMDRAASIFRPDSEVSRLNRAGGRPVRTSADFALALRVALRAAALTDGAVDPTVGRAIELWEAGGRVHVSRGRPADWRAVSLDEQTVSLAAHMRLDLGATAKALTADLAAAAIHRETGCGVLVNLAGDIALAGEAPRDGWRVRAMDDHRGGPDDPGQTVAIRAGGLATSSTTVRRRRIRGIEHHHIADPSTGRPAAGPWRTVTVAAADCVAANTASTAAVVGGERAPAWLSARRLPARLVAQDGSVTTTCDWPAC